MQKAYLRPETAKKLAAANREFDRLAYRIKIFDAYRPFSVQKVLYAKVPREERLYIANPSKNGSNHNRGTAVDMTIERLDGSPVKMPTDFDAFNYKAGIYDRGCTPEERQNREFLASVMVGYGFVREECEWWHFNDSDSAEYRIIDIIF